jgi:L-2-hydroxyglutarate oxidase LhgO
MSAVGATSDRTLTDPLPVGPVDLAVVGAGIVGLATARELLRRSPGLRLAVVDKEPRVAAHQTGHNSGVLHAGLYYPPGSLKARLCTTGKRQLERFAEEHGIAMRRCGKLVIAVDDGELDRLDALRDRAVANGVPGLEVLGPDGIRDHEPHATGVRALWSPSTGIIDYVAVAEALAADIRADGGTITLSCAVDDVQRRSDEITLSTSAGPLRAARLVVCAGLQADSVSRRCQGDDVPERIVPFRGDYYTLTPDARGLVNGLIYPVPDSRFPFLGVHLTRRIDGEVLAGPNAVLAFTREGYRRREVRLGELGEILRYRGFHRLARRYWQVGAAEMWRDVSKRAFLRELRRYVPALEARQMRFGPSGVRAQAVDPDGTLVDDFRLGGDDRVLAVRNAPSPAATASLAIGAALADDAARRFGKLSA